MNEEKTAQQRTFEAARDFGVSQVIFRNAIAKSVGLYTTDTEALSILSIKGVASPKELAHHTGLTTGSTTAMLNRLEEAGFIKRKPNPNDRRGVIVESDEKWLETVGPIVGGVQKLHHELIATYSEEELAIITDFLTRFTQNVVDYTKVLEEERTEK